MAESRSLFQSSSQEELVFRFKEDLKKSGIYNPNTGIP